MITNQFLNYQNSEIEMQDEVSQLHSLYQVLQDSNFVKSQLVFLKRMSIVSTNQKMKQQILIIFAIYQVKIKKDYHEAFNCIFEAEQLGVSNTYLNTAVLRMTKSMIFTYLEQYQQSLRLLAQSLTFFKKTDTKEHPLKSLLIKMVPELIRLHKISTFRKKYLQILENAYQIVTNSVRIKNNQQIQQALKGKIQQLSEKIACMNSKICLKNLRDSGSKDSRNSIRTKSSKGNSQQKPAWKSPYYQQQKQSRDKISIRNLGGGFTGVRFNQKIIKKRNLSPQNNPYMLQKQRQKGQCRLI